MHEVIRYNFYFSVLFSVIGGILVLFNPGLVFPEIMQIYGPLSRNLLVIIFYLVAMQMLFVLFRYRHQGYLESLFMGMMFFIAALGIPYYSHINELPTSIELVQGLSYCSLSHLVYFIDVYIHMRLRDGNKPHPL